MADFEFDNELIEWRGPAPHYFVPVPASFCEAVREIARDVTYGWGMVPVAVRIGDSQWETSLWPKDGGYLVPVRAWVRRAEALEPGASVEVGLNIASRARCTPDRSGCARPAEPPMVLLPGSRHHVLRGTAEARLTG